MTDFLIILAWASPFKIIKVLYMYIYYSLLQI